jgi:peptide/nickel transport system substrate-binding protein
MAGPYRIEPYDPKQGVVLTRNPNYHGARPHRLQRIELAVNIPTRRAVEQVLAGKVDYAVDGEIATADAATLAARYGPGSPAARTGHQRYFVNPFPQLDLFALNTHRPLFSDVRMRRAVNYAIDRAALARLGGADGTLPDHPTDHYLPPGIPGYTDLRSYPLTPDLAASRKLAAGHAPATAVLYTCDQPPCAQQAQVVKTNLAAIGIRVETKVFAYTTLFRKYTVPGERFDIAAVGWGADYPDPDNFLNLLLDSGTIIPTFNDSAYRARLAAAARLSGARRYLTYARLDRDLTRDAAPWIAYGNASSHELYSSRIGCQTYGFYGVDLAALCVRRTRG